MKKGISIALGIIVLMTVVVVVLSGDGDGECEAPTSQSSAGGDFAYPVDRQYKVSSPFGPRWGTEHQGVDFAAPHGSPIYAFAAGKVVDARDTGVAGFGGWVVIDHEIEGKKVSTVYGHQDPGGNLVKQGETVKAGQQIAKVGNSGQSTGPHLHFEVWEGGRLSGGKPVDPEQGWLEKADETAGRAASGASVFIIGDSLTVAAEAHLKKKIPGVEIDAKVGRQYGEGLRILQEKDVQASTVFMLLGTNGAFSADDIAETKKAAAGAQVILMTVGGAAVSSAPSVNNVVKSSRLPFVDWAQAVKADPALVGEDGIHPTATGAEKFADLVASKVSAGSSSERRAPAAASGERQDGESIEDFRARQIVGRGEERGEDEDTILAALAAAKVESQMKMLASEAVPESMQYPNDGVVPGDYDSVGLFQTRVSVHGPKHGGVKGLMDPKVQIDWFYDTAKTVTDSSTPWLLAANVEQPRADLRGKYALEEEYAREKYKQFSGNSAGSLGDASAKDCGGSLEGSITNGDLGNKILGYARKQFGLPYVWGGGDHHGPTGGGFDCSGLTMYAVYQATDGEVALLHHTDQQEAHSALKTVSWEDRKPGDLLFFPGASSANPWEKYHHVSIYSGEKDGKAMQYEAQTYGVNSGEYPVRMTEGIVVKRVTISTATSEKATDEQEKDS